MSKVGRVRGCCFWLLGPRVTRPAAAASRWTSSRSAPSLRPTQHPYPLHKMDKTLISLINKVSKILTHPCLGTLGADQLIRSVSCLPLPASRSRPFARSPVARSTHVRPPAPRRLLIDRRPEPHRACLASSLRETPKADACRGLGVYDGFVLLAGVNWVAIGCKRRVGSTPDRSHRVSVEVRPEALTDCPL